jgi:hypothetical protein
MAADAQAALAAALDRMWRQHLPVLIERVDVLDAAAAAFASGELTARQHQAAQAAAHKLAGVLGTFGLTRGTVLARELEIVYSRQNEPDAELAARVQAIATELRAVIATRK